MQGGFPFGLESVDFRGEGHSSGALGLKALDATSLRGVSGSGPGQCRASGQRPGAPP